MTIIVDFSRLSDAEYKLISYGYYGDLRKESVIARVLLCYILDNCYGIRDYDLCADERGKPYIKDSPLFVSISHSGECAMVSVSENNIGCDFQKTTVFNEKIASRYFTKKENDLLKNCSEPDEVFTKLWTLKEAILKKNGDGLSGGLSSFDFSKNISEKSFELYGCHFTSENLVCGTASVCAEGKSEIIKCVGIDVLIDYCKKCPKGEQNESD